MGGIVWLASYPKSGNTWLRAFLHNLLMDPPAPAPINELDRFCYGDSQLNWYLPHLHGRNAAELGDAEIMALRAKVQESFAKSKADSVFVKTHNMLGTVAGLPLVCMQWTSGAIYVIRNPLDVVLSLSNHAGLSIDRTIDVLGDRNGRTMTDDINVFEFHGGWSRNVDSWTHHQAPGLMWLRYEDMLAEPSAAFGEVARFLGIAAAPQQLAKAIEFSSFKELAKQEAAGGFREKPQAAEKFFRAGKAEQWREVLSKKQIDRLVKDHGRMMEKFGYLP